MTADVRFPRSTRLLQASDYSRVFARSTRVSDKYWTILASSNQCSRNRLGMAIAKKRAKRAVDRNRLKRVIREHFRHNQMAMVTVDLVIMNRDAAVNATNNELRRSLETLWEKLFRQLSESEKKQR